MIRPPPPGPHIPSLHPATRDAPPVRYSLLVFPGFPLMAFAAVMEPLRAAESVFGPCDTLIALPLSKEDMVRGDWPKFVAYWMLRARRHSTCLT